MAKAVASKKRADVAALSKRPASADGRTDSSRLRADGWPSGDADSRRYCDDADLRRPVAGPPHPDWSGHYFNVLRENFERLIEKLGTDATVTPWNDCARKCTEASA